MNREADIQTFLKAQMIFFCIAANDGHSKNFSIQYTDGGFQLCPLYDVISMAPFIGKRIDQIPEQKLTLAMSVGNSRHYRLNDIQKRHLA